MATVKKYRQEKIHQVSADSNSGNISRAME